MGVPLVRAHRVPLAGVGGDEVLDVLVQAADIPEADWLSGHRGVDLEAAAGQEILASRGGVVYFAGSVAGTPVVSIQHSDGVRTTYEPVIAEVAKGQVVRRGQVIGALADAASLPETARKADGLSWGARLGEGYVDPLELLGQVRVRLYP